MKWAVHYSVKMVADFGGGEESVEVVAPSCMGYKLLNLTNCECFHVLRFSLVHL